MVLTRAAMPNSSQRERASIHIFYPWEPARLSSELDSNPRAYVQNHPVARTHGSIIECKCEHLRPKDSVSGYWVAVNSAR